MAVTTAILKICHVLKILFGVCVIGISQFSLNRERKLRKMSTQGDPFSVYILPSVYTYLILRHMKEEGIEGL